jgi:hypothetical protein
MQIPLTPNILPSILTELKSESQSKKSGVVAMGSDRPADSGGKGSIWGGDVFSTGLAEVHDEEDIFFVGYRDSFHGLPFIG